jgi:hypothetical protein
MVRAKFTCTSNQNGQVTFVPVYDGNPESENGKFFEATPSGSISLGIVNEAASVQFVEGKEYFVDFTPAEANTASGSDGDDDGA